MTLNILQNMYNCHVKVHTYRDAQGAEAIWKRVEAVVEERPRVRLHPAVAYRRQPQVGFLWLEELAYADLEVAVESTCLDAVARVANFCDLLFVEVGDGQSALRFNPRIWKCWTLIMIMKVKLKNSKAE